VEHWIELLDGAGLVQDDVFITVDRNLSFQQNIPQFDIAV
jgi:hypothetical protein